MAHKMKLVYPGDEPGHTHIIELWTDGPHALAGHVLDAMMGSYSPTGRSPLTDVELARNFPMRIEIIPNSPDMPHVQTESPEEG